MSPLFVVLIGLLGGALTTASWVPQLFRTWRTRSARDFSWGYLSLFASGVFCWGIYGALRADLVILLTNVFTFTLVASVGGIKWSDERRREPLGK
jgi:MtN3 and saliva related transmembrane protein